MTVLTDTFDGAANGKLVDRPNWAVTGDAGLIERTYVDGSGNLVIKDDYGSALTALYGSVMTVGTMTRWEHPRLFNTTAEWDRARLYLWGGRVQVYYGPAFNRLWVVVGSNTRFVTIPAGQAFTASSGTITAGPTEFDLRASISANGQVLSFTLNGEAFASTVDISAIPSADRTGKSGLWFEKMESFASPRIVARSFSVDDGQGGGTPTPTPAPSPTPSPSPSPTPTPPASKAHTVAGPPRFTGFVPRLPGGVRSLRFTATKTGGGTITGMRYRVRSDVLGETTKPTFQDWQAAGAVSIASDNITIGGNVVVVGGRTEFEGWLYDVELTYDDGATSQVLGIPVVCGILAAGIGQSNLGGLQQAIRTDGPSITNRAYVLFHIDDGDPSNDAAWDYRGPGLAQKRTNLLQDVASQIARDRNMPVAMFAAGQYAASLYRQLPGEAGWTGPSGAGIAMLDMIRRGGGWWPELLFVIQGENEGSGADGPGGVTNWPTHLATLKNAFRDAAGLPAAPITVGVIGRYKDTNPPAGTGSGAAATNGYWTGIRAAQLGVHNPSDGVRTGFHMLGLGEPRTTGDAYHYNYEAKRAMLPRIGRALAVALGSTGPDGRGPLPTRAIPNGSNLDVEHALNGAASMSGSNLTAWETSPDASGDTWSAVPPADAFVPAGTSIVRLNGRSTARRVRALYGFNPDDSSMALGTYADGSTIPAMPVIAPMAVTAAGTPAPSPTPSPAPTPTPVPTPTPTPPASGRGAITASAARTARFSETQDASPRGAGVPAGAVIISAPMDPHTKRDFAFDFSSVLGTSELAELTKIVVNPIGFLDGFRIMANPAPFLNAEGRIGQVRAEVLSNRQDDEIFTGSGTQADVTVGGRLADGQTIEATFIVPLRNL